MGNQIVIPSMSSWYVEPLKRLGIKVCSVLESCTFFITLDCINLKDNSSIIVKAFETNEDLDENNISRNCQIYFSLLHKSAPNFLGLTDYNGIFTKSNVAFLCRKKHQFTLSQRMDEYPPLEPIEKLWISYRILKLLYSLHELDLFHGAINPDNVFVTWDLDVSIGDMAPYKPSHVKVNRPDLFHHFFTTAFRGACYLAPEQLLKPDENTDDVMYGRGIFSMDYFAAGLVIYYLYTGNHLFNFSSLAQYAAKQNNIENQLSKVPKEIRNMLEILLQIDGDQRANIIRRGTFLQSHFPSAFEQISNQFDEFFYSEMNLHHLIMLIPMFQMTMEKIALSNDNGDEEEDARVIFVNVFSSFLNSSEMIQETSIFMNFFCDFALPLNDQVKLGRVLPVFCGMLSSNSNNLKSSALLCILKVIYSLKKIPPEFERIFDSYLIQIILNSSIGANVQYRCMMASLCPILAIEIARLQPESAHLAIELVNFVLNEDHDLVLSSFIQSMRIISSAKSENNYNKNTTSELIQSNDSDEQSPQLIDSGNNNERTFNSQAKHDSDDILLTSSDDKNFNYTIRVNSNLQHTPTLFPEARGCHFNTFAKFSHALLSCLNNLSTKMKLEILHIFINFYDNCPISEKSYYRHHYNEMVPLMLGFMCDEEDDEMICGYIEIILWFLHRGLIQETKIPEVLLKINDFRRHENPVIRFFSKKIASLVPNKLDVMKIPVFLMDILYQRKPRVLTINQTLLLKHNFYGSQYINKSNKKENNSQQTKTNKFGDHSNKKLYHKVINNSPLILKAGISIKPKFLKNQRLTQRPVSIIAPHFENNLCCIISDTESNLFCIRNNLTNYQLNFHYKSVVSISEIRQTNSTLISEKGGIINFVDLKMMTSKVSETFRFNSDPIKIISYDRCLAYCLLDNGEFGILDSRSPSFTSGMKFANDFSPSSMCNWQQGSNAIGIGFEEGLVSIVDSRMMLPVVSIITEKVNAIAPCYRNCCNFVVSSDECIECFDAFLRLSELKINIKNTKIVPYDGNIVIISNNNVFYLDCENYDNSSLLGDLSFVSKVLSFDDGNFNFNTRDFCPSGSLHKHASPITVADHSKEIFITGDTNGFVNLWAISDI